MAEKAKVKLSEGRKTIRKLKQKQEKKRLKISDKNFSIHP